MAFIKISINEIITSLKKPITNIVINPLIKEVIDKIVYFFAIIFNFSIWIVFRESRSRPNLRNGEMNMNVSEIIIKRSLKTAQKRDNRPIDDVQLVWPFCVDTFTDKPNPPKIGPKISAKQRKER